ncbi:MAG TPA: metalloregulator ArsR/SmtB family transcription factor [Vicinamibacterales bacterium]|nr:metalloregulator ArsR/SmtB family transcription factor [Vicinamibacterales bacterium]
MYVDTASLLRLLGDPTRLRLLRALSAESLNVSELTAVLGVAQSGVSRHLGLLRDAGLVTEERAGGFSWYRPSDTFSGSDGPSAPLAAWLREEFRRSTQETRADDARLEEVRRLRKENFSAHALTGEERRQLVPGRSWPAWSRALGMLLPEVDVADLGCGEGYLTLEAARWARHVTAVDRAKDVLARGRELARRRKLRNITWKRGDIERVPIADSAVEIAILSQALHHADSPERALSEAHRILKPGGRLLVLDLREHQEAWVKARLGDKWLGFSEERLHGLLRETGFTKPLVRIGARRTGDPFTVLVASGTK